MSSDVGVSSKCVAFVFYINESVKFFVVDE